MCTLPDEIWILPTQIQHYDVMMTLDYVIVVSSTLCPEVGNDEHILL